MKRAYLLIWLCLAPMLLTSCSSLPLIYPDELTSDNTQVDGMDGNPNSYNNPIHNTKFDPQPLYQYLVLNATVVRFNITTGEVTYLCDDPLCSHNAGSDCLFADVGLDFAVDDQQQVICYVSDQKLIRYDIAQKKADILYTIDHSSDTEDAGGARTSLAHGYYWYQDAYAKIFFRVNLNTGVYEEIDTAYDIPTAYIDGRYYCTANGSPATEVYSLNANMQNKQTVLEDCILYYVNFDHVTAQDSGYITFSEWKDGELIKYAYDLALNQKAEYHTDQKSGQTWGDFVCYTQTVDRPRLMGECGLNGEIYNRTGGTVYRYNTVTGTEEILFSNDDLVIGMPQVIENYLVYDFGAFVVHNVYRCPHWQIDAGGKLVIDIETGDYCIYHNTWDKTLWHYPTSAQHTE